MAGPPHGRWVPAAFAVTAILVAIWVLGTSRDTIVPGGTENLGGEAATATLPPAGGAVGVAADRASQEPSPASDEAARLPGTIRLRVLHRGDGLPLEGASARAVRGGTTAAQSQSDPRGAVVLSSLDADVPHDVIVERAPHAPVRLLGVRVAAGEDRDLGTVSLGAGYLLRGTVADGGGVGIPGAQLALFEAQAASPSLESGERLHGAFRAAETPVAVATAEGGGSFEVQGVPAGRYDLVASASGRVTSRIRGIRLSDLHPEEAVRVVLSAGGRIRGRVTTVGGATHRGLRILALPVAMRGSGRRGHSPTCESAAQEDGRYQIDGLEIGSSFRLAVVQIGRATYVAPEVIVVVERDVEWDLDLPATGRIEGTVRRRGTGTGVEGATVQLSVDPAQPQTARTPEGRLPRAAASVVTGPDGTFEVAGLPEGRVSGLVRAPGCLPTAALSSGATAWGNVLAGQSIAVEIEVAGGASVLGLVRLGRDGPPVRGANVLLLIASADLTTGPMGGVPRATTDSEGSFRIDGLASGSYEVVARSLEASVPLVRGTPTRIYVPEGAREVHTEIVLKPAVRLQGVVRGGGDGPVAGAEVSVIRATAGATEAGARLLCEEALPLPTDRTDDQGRFLLDGLPPGASWLVEVRAPGFVPTTSGFVDPAALDGMPVEIRLRPAARLAGRVTDETGAPVAGATVLARWSAQGAAPWPVDGGAPHPEASVKTSRTTEDGRFVLEGLGSGLLQILVTHPDRASTEGGQRWIAEGKAIEDVVIVLEPGRSILGRVVDAQGRPVPGARIAGIDPDPGSAEGLTAASLAGATRLGRMTRTDAEGRFELRHLADRPHAVVVLRDSGVGEEPGASLFGVRPGTAEVWLHVGAWR